MRKPWTSDRLDDLSQKVDDGLAAIERRFVEADARIDKRFKEADARIDKRFKEADARIDMRFKEADARIDKRFGEVDRWFQQVEVEIGKVNGRLDLIDERFGRLESSIDHLKNMMIGFAGTAVVGLILSQFA